eukprot:scaffold90515_cov57-Phaeocystis_antarctica.AAC.1
MVEEGSTTGQSAWPDRPIDKGSRARYCHFGWPVLIIKLCALRDVVENRLSRCLAAHLDVLNRCRDVSQANDRWDVVKAAQAKCNVIVEQLQRVLEKGDRKTEHTQAGEQSRVHRVEDVIGTQAITGRSKRKPP